MLTVNPVPSLPLHVAPPRNVFIGPIKTFVTLIQAAHRNAPVRRRLEQSRVKVYKEGAQMVNLHLIDFISP